MRSRMSWAAVSMSRLRLKVAMTKEVRARGDRAQLLDPLDGVDRLLDLLRDLGLGLLGRGAGQGRAHRDRRQVDRGEAVDPQPAVAGGAHDDQGEDDHGREHRPADTDLGELLHRRLAPLDDATRTASPVTMLPGCDHHRLAGA